MRFLSLYRPLFVSLVLVTIHESLQLLLDIDYYPYLSTPGETIASAGLCLLLVAALLAVIIYIITVAIRYAGLKGTFLLGVIEVVSVLTVLLMTLPSLISVNKPLSETMILFWKYGVNLSPAFSLPVLPIILILATVVLRLILKKRFKAAINSVAGFLWKPALVVTAISVLWMFLFIAFLAGPDKTAKSNVDVSPAKQAAKEQMPNIILITFDSLGTNDMSLYGYSRRTTPFWEEFAKESFVFQNMHSNYQVTTPSITSVLTAKYPWSHGVFIWLDNLKSNPEENISAPLRNDYYTAAIVPSMYQLPDFLGLRDQFDSTNWVAFASPIPMLSNLISALGLSSFSFPLLRHINYSYNRGTPLASYDEPFIAAKKLFEAERDRPLFLWLHLWPPHFPNYPPPGFRGVFLPSNIEVGTLDGKTGEMYDMTLFQKKARHDESVLYSDSILKDIISTLKKSSLYENSVIIVSSDHGNTFAPGNRLVTSNFMEEPIFHIPLLIHLPGQTEGAIIDTMAEEVDLGPTILDLAGKPIPDWMDGESLLPYMKDPTLDTNRTKYSMSFIYGTTHKSVRWVTAYRGDYKLIYDYDTDTSLLFRINDIHTFENNLAREKKRVALKLKNDILEKIDENYRIFSRDR